MPKKILKKVKEPLKKAGHKVGFRDISHIPQTVKALSLVSFFMNITSVTVTTVVPLMVISVFGASMKTLGVIEGIVTASAFFSKIFSGVISDFFHRRKLFILLGYGASALTMPIFALAPTVGWVFMARFIDRLSNGFRDAPRDALISDVTPKAYIGLCYGFRQALGILGSVVGPLIIIFFLYVTDNNYQKAFWLACIPATIAVTIGVLGIQDPTHLTQPQRRKKPLNFSDLKHFKPNYWRLVAVATIFMAGQYSDAFLVLRAEASGIPPLFIPLVLVLVNLAYSGASIPVGSLSDRFDRRLFLALGFLSLIVGNLILAHGESLLTLVGGVLIWGLHKGFTQGVLAAMVADAAPAHLRGTAFGFFHLISGVGQFIANLVIGWFWHAYDMATAFQVSSCIMLIPLLGLLLLRDLRHVEEARI